MPTKDSSDGSAILFLLYAIEIIDERIQTRFLSGLLAGTILIGPDRQVPRAVRFDFLSPVNYLGDSTLRKDTSVLFVLFSE